MEHLELPDSSIESPKKKPLYFGKGLLYALTILFAQLLVGAIVLGIGVVAFGLGEEIQQGSFSVASQEKITNLIMAVALPGSFLLAVFILLRRRQLHPMAFQWNASFLKLIPLGLLMLFGLDYILGELMTLLPNYDQMLEDYQTMFAGIDMVYLFIGGVIIGPICEEIIFRGIIEEGFLETYTPNKAVLFSAMIFGGIHLVPLQVLSAFLAGILLGWIYWKTRSLWIVMILHIVNNYIAFTFSDFDTHSAKGLFSNDLLYYGSFVVALVLMYGAYVLFKRIAEREEVSSQIGK